MDKEQAIHYIWSQFGLKAYDENSVPDDAQMPYITYNVSVSPIDRVVLLNGSIWYRSTSWTEVTEKAHEIAEYIGGQGHVVLKIDGGYVWFVQGSPFAQRMADDGDDSVKRIYINIEAEFLTQY